MHFLQKPNQTPPPKLFFEKMQSSATSNNRFAALSGLKTPSGKFVLASASSSGKKETPAATGSNAIPIWGNKKSFSKKVGTGPTLKRKPNMNSLKPMPVKRAQSARPGSLAARPTNKNITKWNPWFSPPIGL